MSTARASTFGNEFAKVWPELATPTLTNFAKEMLEACKELHKPSAGTIAVDLEKFMELSDRFPCKFPVETCRVKAQPKARTQHIQQQIASAYPIVHERTLFLYMRFLEHKRQLGNAIELRVYKQMSLVDFVQRLLSKRCVYFLGSDDRYMLLKGRRGGGGFESIGSAVEQEPLLLRDVLSYDEIKLAALLYVSSHSEFINDGNRNNMGQVVSDKATIERAGVIIGLIGARFERRLVMEWQDILITPTQNTAGRGYGAGSGNERTDDYRRMWRHFYEEQKDFEYDDVQIDHKRFGPGSKPGVKFDNVVMKKRFAIPFDTLLLESEARAVAAGKPAYIHVVGIGLGVWKIAAQQEQIFLETFEERMRTLAAQLTHIGCVHFAWFHLSQWGGLCDGARILSDKHPDGGILVRISKRNPAAKLAENMLPVVSYAWDGNALPGNEFWMGSLAGSGDPAAAASTLITELHNPHINVNYTSGANLHIASLKHGIQHIGDYARTLLSETS